MEHQAESKMRNLATDMKWCPKYVKWQTQTTVHVLVNVYVGKTLWKMVKVAASGQETRDKGTWYRLYYDLNL